MNETDHSGDNPPATRLSRATVPALDELFGVSHRVLDGGFIRLVDYMGSDSAIVQAARVSYGAGTKRVQDDRGLIRYLMRHAHTTPFEMCEIKFHIRAPMDCWRQWIRHRTASVNEYSTRYSVAIDAAQRTPTLGWRKQAASNHQGSAGIVLSAQEGEKLSAREGELQALAREIYDERLAAGIAREQARKDLPLSTYTEAYWKIDLHNLFHFLSLRMDLHAQTEIREYANLLGRLFVAKWCPLAWEAFVDYRLNSLKLSSKEVEILRSLLESPELASATAVRLGLLDPNATRGRHNRELEELETKLTILGLQIPWRV